MSHSTTKESKPRNILIPLFTGFNTLDVNGPLDAICNFALRNPNGNGAGDFIITTTGITAGPLKAYEFAHCVADIAFEEAINNIKAGMYDVLLVPGYGPTFGENSDDTLKKIFEVIKTFHDHDNIPSTEKGKGPHRAKWLISICVGGLLCASAGVFGGLDVTTHFMSLETCEKNAIASGHPAHSVTRERFIDAGFAEPAEGQSVKTRILTSGGISCGLDASLYFIKEVYDIGTAWKVAQTMDYNWNVATGKSVPVKITPPAMLK